ncbi:Ring finger domain/RING-like zinc finger containing protein, putative [Angomonas deanei]|uniref:Ring finger domain/RING-like zinc finger containing protein, putative n=1 Tax=Angomonas deanei TaxID=59799 RepID=A0A7G2C7H1_9TRYP|nr:Ring finger domain/RING-like zinc finger containing protein, putative [Angomonas deanei]
MSTGIFSLFANLFTAVPFDGEILYPLFSAIVWVAKHPDHNVELKSNSSVDMEGSSGECGATNDRSGEGDEVVGHQFHRFTREECDAVSNEETVVPAVRRWYTDKRELFTDMLFAVATKLVFYRARVFYCFRVQSFPIITIRRKLRSLRLENADSAETGDNEECIKEHNLKNMAKVMGELREGINDCYTFFLEESLSFYALEYEAMGAPMGAGKIDQVCAAMADDVLSHVNRIIQFPMQPRCGREEFRISLEQQAKQFEEKVRRENGNLHAVFCPCIQEDEDNHSSMPNEEGNVPKKESETKKEETSPTPLAEEEESSEQDVLSSVLKDFTEYLECKTPSDSALMQRVCARIVQQEKHLREEKKDDSIVLKKSAESLLYPTTSLEDCTDFLGGYIRVAPYCTPPEVDHILCALAVPTATDIMDPTHYVNLNEALNNASDSSLTPSEREALYEQCTELHLPADDDPCKEMITIVVIAFCVRLELANPIMFEYACGYRCDCCGRSHVQVAFRSVLYRGIGFDVCLTCVVFLYKEYVKHLVAAVSTLRCSRQPFRGLDCRRPLQWLWSLEVTEGEEDGVWHVEAVVGLAMYSTLPAMWTVPAEQLAGLEDELAATRDEEAPEYITVTQRVEECLPHPPADWRQRCAIERTAAVSVGKEETCFECEDNERCAICLGNMRDEKEIPLRTLCGHWFHMACIDDVRFSANDDDGNGDEEDGALQAGGCCPLCRRKNYLPKQHCKEAFTTDNLYRMHLTVKPGSGVTSVDVAVGVLLSRDGIYHNPSNIGALQMMRVMPGFLYRSEWTS